MHKTAKEALDFISKVNDGKYYNFSENLIQKCYQVLSNLEHEPFISPTGRGSIQFEYEKENDDYLEFEFFENRIEVYIEYGKGKLEEKILAEDDLDSVYDIIRKFMK